MIKKQRKYYYEIVLLFIILFVIHKIYLNPNDNNFENEKTYEVTVISSYFSLNKSKHNHEEYNDWIKNFFSSVSPLVLFTDGKSISRELMSLRKNLATKLYIVDSHWNLLEEIEKKRGKKYSASYWQEQNRLDPEQSIHNPDLYILWNMKSYITKKVVQENPFSSSVFIYTDAGAWRSKPLYNWPDVKMVRNVSKLIKNKILFGQISNSGLEKSSRFPLCDIIEGTFFMGNAKAIENFEKEFWRLHDIRIEQGLFVGKDQTIMNLLAFNSTMSYSIARLKTWDLKCEKPVDVWHFYQYFLANDNYYKCERPREKFLIY